jgi:hypothetical protein
VCSVGIYYKDNRFTFTLIKKIRKTTYRFWCQNDAILLLPFWLNNQSQIFPEKKQSVVDNLHILGLFTFHCASWPFFKAKSIHSSNVAILELIRGAQCLIEVIWSSCEEMWRVDAYQIPYYSRGIEGETRTHPRLFIVLFSFWNSAIP